MKIYTSSLQLTLIVGETYSSRNFRLQKFKKTEILEYMNFTVTIYSSRNTVVQINSNYLQ